MSNLVDKAIELQAMTCLYVLLDRANHDEYLSRIGKKEALKFLEENRQYVEIIKSRLQRLEVIDNANPSEALEETLRDIAYDLENDDNPFLRDRYYGLLDLKQALLKAEKEQKSLNLLMQELDCKDFADLRKYARCGYEKMNEKLIQ